MTKIITYVKDYTDYETLKNFNGYLNIENTVTGKRISLCANGHIFSFNVARYQDARVQRVLGEGTKNITLYVTNKEWKNCDLDFECDDFGYPIDYFN